MQSIRTVGVLFTAVTALAALASSSCGGGTSDPTVVQLPPADHAAPGFASGQGQPKIGTVAYPAGPYGISKGSVVENYQFLGFANASVMNDPAAMQNVMLADFYNPHADDPTYAPADASTDDRLYGPDSPYGAGTPKPRVLLIDVASVWCPPCNEEAKTTLPGKHLKYKPCGGEFLLQLADSATPGVAALPADLVRWDNRYKVDYPSSLDPSSKLAALFSQDAFPSNLIIDTRTMKIIDVEAGIPPASFWTKYEATMNAPACLSGK